MTARQEAAGVIRAVLADGPRTAGEVERAAAEVGLSVRTVRRAADECGVIRTRQGAAVMWSLPSQTAGDGGHCAPAGHRRESHAASAVPAGATPTHDTEEIDEMTDTTNDDRPGYVQAVAGGLTWPGAGVLRAGDLVAVPARGSDEWAATTDRDGRSFLDDLTPDAQRQRWGVVHLVEHGGPPADGETVTATEASSVVRREPIRPDPLPHPGGFPSGRRVRPEGSVPLISGLYSNGPVQIVPARRSKG